MTIGTIIGLILACFGAEAIAICFVCVSKVKSENFDFRSLGFAAFASSLWSLGFAVLFASTDTNLAYWGRAIGMIGTCSFLMFAQWTLLNVTRVPTWQRKFSIALSLLWIPVYFLATSRNAAIYTYTPSGMRYVFTPGPANTIYSAFSVIYGINVAVSIILAVRNAQCRREKKTARLYIIMLIVIFFGMILDTILPTLGLEAIPGSTLTQFGGLWVLYLAICEKNKSDITLGNMTEYVYSVISEPLLVFNMDNKLVLFNRASREYFKNDSGLELSKGTRIFDMFDIPEDFLTYEGSYREGECKTKAGKSFVSLNISRIRDKFEDAIGFVVFVKDMTELNNAMESLKLAKAEADSANSAKSNFLANMSHEIRTPLNAIIGFSELLLSDDSLGANREPVEDIRDSSNTLLSIVNDILDISKIESGRMELLDEEVALKPFFKNIALIVEPLARKKELSFAINIDPEIPSKIIADSGKLRGIMINIINNSVKYTHTGGIKFDAKLISSDARTACLEFAVEDTGIGMKPEAMEKLFLPFHRMDTKRNSNIEGTGLGLSIVKGYVDLMKGTIEVKSEYNRGSCFIIRIPFAIADGEPVGSIDIDSKDVAKENTRFETSFDNLRILAVDDNRVNQRVISKCLEKYNVTPVLKNSGEDAIAACAETKFDVILMDQMMPNMDGVEAMKRIRAMDAYYAKSGKAKFVCLTANAISGAKESLIAQGFDAYVSKPIDFAKLAELLTEYAKEK